LEIVPGWPAFPAAMGEVPWLKQETLMDSIRAFFQHFTNSFGTISAICIGITGWLAQQGCLSTGDLAATCNITWLPASTMPYITMVFVGLTLVGKLTRPGGWLRSLFGGTAVVVSADSPKAGVGTVTPEQVAKP
jgi:hypothetical protein